MNRRKFVTAAIAGIGASGVSSVVRANDFIFPRKSEVKPFLEGLTDEDMAALIEQFPHKNGCAELIWSMHPGKRAVVGIEFYEHSKEFHTQLSIISLWTMEGTTIHVVEKTPEFTVHFSGDRVQTGWSIKKTSVDVKSIDLIRLITSSPEFKRTEYRRIETVSGAGWFTING